MDGLTEFNFISSFVVASALGGYIYLMVNKGQIGLCKIGTGGKLKKRQNGLYHGDSGVPTHFDIIDKVWVENPQIKEKAIHNLLDECRFNQRREHFAPRIMASGGDISNLTIKQLQEMLSKEVIEPTRLFFAALRLMYKQPDEDVSEIEQEDVSEIEDEDEVGTGNVNEFVVRGVEYYNNDTAFARAIANKALSTDKPFPDWLKSMNPREHGTCVNTIRSWIIKNK